MPVWRGDKLAWTSAIMHDTDMMKWVNLSLPVLQLHVSFCRKVFHRYWDVLQAGHGLPEWCLQHVLGRKETAGYRYCCTFSIFIQHACLMHILNWSFWQFLKCKTTTEHLEQLHFPEVQSLACFSHVSTACFWHQSQAIQQEELWSHASVFKMQTACCFIDIVPCCCWVTCRCTRAPLHSGTGTGGFLSRT